MPHRNKATPFCSNRMYEWAATVMITQCGLLAILSDIVLDTRPQLAFTAFTHLGLNQIWTGIVFLFVGTIGTVALARNGQWKDGPMVRAVCAVIRAVIWANLLIGIVEVWFNTKQIYLSITIWDTLLVFEYFSFQRALMDRREKGPAVLGVGDGC